MSKIAIHHFHYFVSSLSRVFSCLSRMHKLEALIFKFVSRKWWSNEMFASETLLNHFNLAISFFDWLKHDFRFRVAEFVVLDERRRSINWQSKRWVVARDLMSKRLIMLSWISSSSRFFFLNDWRSIDRNDDDVLVVVAIVDETTVIVVIVELLFSSQKMRE